MFHSSAFHGFQQSDTHHQKHRTHLPKPRWAVHADYSYSANDQVFPPCDILRNALVLLMHSSEHCRYHLHHLQQQYMTN